MFTGDAGGPHGGPHRGAFTLIEIITAMTIIAIIAAVAVPVLKGMNEEEKSRAPLVALAEMVQETRMRAMKEHRPYEIIMEQEGLHALPGNPSFSKRDEFFKHLEELRTPPPVTEFEMETVETAAVERTAPSTPAGTKPLTQNPEPTAGNETGKRKRPDMPWTQSIPLENGLKAEALFWGDGDWDRLEGDRMRRWVFQANGMCSPVRVRFVTPSATLEAGFDGLTGEMSGESLRPATGLATR
ncbi:MAG: hypothetical protein JWL81_2762 [Verrucomicrobiales bacterium]|nr:hypothetical protein [Verrucomicrobiales bacterium]